MDMYFEDFDLQSTMKSPARTITEADIVAFTGLSGDYNALHINEELAKDGLYKTRVAQGLLSVSIITGLQALMGHVNNTSLGLLELQWQFKKGVVAGDTIHGEFTVEHKRLTSAGNTGVLTRSVVIKNQHDLPVSYGKLILLMKCKNYIPS